MSSNFGLGTTWSRWGRGSEIIRLLLTIVLQLELTTVDIYEPDITITDNAEAGFFDAEGYFQ